MGTKIKYRTWNQTPDEKDHSYQSQIWHFSLSLSSPQKSQFKVLYTKVIQALGISFCVNQD